MARSHAFAVLIMVSTPTKPAPLLSHLRPRPPRVVQPQADILKHIGPIPSRPRQVLLQLGPQPAIAGPAGASIWGKLQWPWSRCKLRPEVDDPAALGRMLSGADPQLYDRSVRSLPKRCPNQLSGLNLRQRTMATRSRHQFRSNNP